jgi:hypothetical protein
MAGFNGRVQWPNSMAGFNGWIQWPNPMAGFNSGIQWPDKRPHQWRWIRARVNEPSGAQTAPRQ